MFVRPLGINNNSLRLNTHSSVLNKQSSNPDFSSHMRNAASIGSHVASDAARYAMPYVPGRALLSAAVNGAAGQINSPGALSQTLSAEGADDALGANALNPNHDFQSSMGDLQQNMRKENIEMIALQKEIQ